MIFVCRSSEGGRRTASSAVAALPATTRATALLTRRWAAEGGPEGRLRENRLAAPDILLQARATDEVL